MPMPTPKPRRLQDILRPAAEVEHMFRAHALHADVSGLKGAWAIGYKEAAMNEHLTLPTVALTYGDGGWGKRAYMHATPAHRCHGPDPGGDSHLVAQQRGCGHWAIRRLTDKEVFVKLSGWHCDLKHPVHPTHPRASELYGRSSQVDMQIGVLKHWLDHMRVK